MPSKYSSSVTFEGENPPRKGRSVKGDGARARGYRGVLLACSGR